MSRTRKGKKGPGAELWGKKPFNGASPNAENKRISRKMDRAQGRVRTKKQTDDGLKWEGEE